MNTNISSHQLDLLSRTAAAAELAKAFSNLSRSLYGNICVLHGAEGIGKTEQLLQTRDALCAQFPDAQIYINLKYLETDPLRIEKTIAKIIHTFAPFAILVDDVQALRAQYLELLQQKRVLLLLDDFFSKELVSVLAPPENSALLATTTQPVELLNAPQIELPPLTFEDAEHLLVELCPRIGGMAPAVADVCHYQPLALRLAAAGLNASAELTAAEFLSELQGITNTSTAQSPLATLLEYLIERIYELSSPRAQEQIRRLSILRSSFGETLAVALLTAALPDAPNAESPPSLRSFVRIGFLNWDRRAGLFQMHPVVHKFIASRVEASGPIWHALANVLRRQLSECEKLAQSGSDGFVLSLASFDEYEECLNEILNWANATHQDQAGKIMFDLVGYARLFGRLRFLPRKQIVPWFQHALEYAMRVSDNENTSTLLADLSRAHRHLGDNDTAQAYSFLRDDFERRTLPSEFGDSHFVERVRKLSTHHSMQDPPASSRIAAQPAVQSQAGYNMGKANIVLTGFMGSGKTTVGKQLAELLGYQFIDTDELIEAREGRSISDIFAQLGEATFRQIERDIAQELSTSEKLVISTGGRMMLDPANVEALSRQGRVFCLVATPQEILTRVSHDTTHKRPLLAVPNPEERIVELLQERSDKYRRFPQVITDRIKPVDVAQNLLELINTDPKHFVIDQTTASYGFIVGAGLLPFFRQLADIQGPAVVITEPHVRELYGPSFASVERIIELSGGERREKTLASAERVYNDLLELGFDRTGTIISLGGSAVGDVAGFVAATYMRGVNLVHCPTSLIAMIDTSIGGKTALDLPNGKNIIGVFKQPSKVIADVTTLQTLPARAFASGMAEVIKHSLLATSDLLEQIETGVWNSLIRDSRPSIAELQTLIAQAVQVKISIVQEDPFERGRRSILNLGHTFAYAIDQLSRGTFTHGECVGLGLVAASNLSAQLGYLEPAMQRRIENALQHFNLPIRLPKTLHPEALVQAMRTDKKKQGKQLHFVLLRGIGDVFVADNVPEPALLETLYELAE